MVIDIFKANHRQTALGRKLTKQITIEQLVYATAQSQCFKFFNKEINQLLKT